MPSVVKSTVDRVDAMPGSVWRIRESSVGVLVVHATAIVTVTDFSTINTLHLVGGFARAQVCPSSRVIETIQGPAPPGGGCFNAG